MENIITRRITLNDLEKLQEIGRKTFEETFSESNSEVNMNNYLEDSFSKEKLTAELQNKNSEFYFAILEDEVIGYLKINFGESQTELKDKKALEIQRIYVAKEFHGKRVGQILYDKAIEIAPKFVSALINRGGLKDENGDYQGAITDYETVLKLDKLESEEKQQAYFNLGNTYFNLKDKKRACENWNKALEYGAEYAKERINEHCK